MARKKRSTKTKKRSKPRKPIGITNISKTNAKKLRTKMGYALVFGTKTKPSLGRSRFKTKGKAVEAYRKKV